jgi:hypothetical protein
MPRQTSMPNQGGEPMPGPADMAAENSDMNDAGAQPAPPAPQVAGQPPVNNPLEGLPPAAQQHILMLTRQVADITAVLQQFIPAVIQRIAELEGSMGQEEEPEAGAGMPPQAPNAPMA